MKNFRNPGVVVDFVAPTGGVEAGVGYVIGNEFLVAVADAAEGATVAGAKHGVFRLPKGTSDALTEKQLCYWDDSAKEVLNASAAGLYLIGTAYAARDAADTYADVELNGLHVIAVPGP